MINRIFFYYFRNESFIFSVMSYIIHYVMINFTEFISYNKLEIYKKALLTYQLRQAKNMQIFSLPSLTLHLIHLTFLLNVTNKQRVNHLNS